MKVIIDGKEYLEIDDPRQENWKIAGETPDGKIVMEKNGKCVAVDRPPIVHSLEELMGKDI